MSSRRYGMPSRGLDPAEGGVDTGSAAWDICPLTRRQLALLRVLSAGYTNKETARLLRLHVNTVAAHMGHIQHRLEEAGGTRLNRTAACTLALARGWIDFPGRVSSAARATGAPVQQRITGSTSHHRERQD